MNKNFNINIPSAIIGAVLGIGVLLLILRPWEGVSDSVQDQIDLIQSERDALKVERDSLILDRVNNKRVITTQDSIILVYENRKYASRNFLRNADRTELVNFFSAVDTSGVFARR